MNYELAKKLKDAGFPQTGDGVIKDIADRDYKVGESIATNTPYYIPTLSELIEACGDEFNNLYFYSSTEIWSCNVEICCLECRRLG